MVTTTKTILSLLVLISMVSYGLADDLRLFLRTDTSPKDIVRKSCRLEMEFIKLNIADTEEGKLIISEIVQVQKKFEKNENAILNEYKGYMNAFLENLTSKRNDKFSDLTEDINRVGQRVRSYIKL